MVPGHWRTHPGAHQRAVWSHAREGGQHPGEGDGVALFFLLTCQDLTAVSRDGHTDDTCLEFTISSIGTLQVP